MKKEMKVGIGFATGRKSFQKVLKTNIFNWRECGLTDLDRIHLNLFVAYDLKYANTKTTDYTEVSDSLLALIDEAYFIGGSLIQREADQLTAKGVITKEEAKLFFAGGYAAKRNAILYLAVKMGMDYLIFFDDDEYPLAVTNSKSSALWGGQHVLYTHLRHIPEADITNGRHCGYISPIPYMTFNELLTEEDFRRFIEALSNDIINWKSIKSVMLEGGVTYANKKVLVSGETEEVAEVNGAKFISGSNLCINLTDPLRVHPFYNPPGARGEDTFLSTCLSDNRVLRLPCYTFHDAFSFYKPLMDGVLPISLRRIKADSVSVVNRFYAACLGWIRYKPLLLFITQPEAYECTIELMKENLTKTLPKVCRYFDRTDFMKILSELSYYHKNVKKHYAEFESTKIIWSKISNEISPVKK